MSEQAQDAGEVRRPWSRKGCKRRSGAEVAAERARVGEAVEAVREARGTPPPPVNQAEACSTPAPILSVGGSACVSSGSSVVINYTPSASGKRLHTELDYDVCMLLGCVGCAKTTDWVWQMFNLATMVPPSPDGVRRCRSAFIRNTQAQLLTTTKNSFLSWFGPSKFGKYYVEHGGPPAKMTIKIPAEENKFCEFPEDEGKYGLEWEILLIPLDSEDDVRRLLGLELTNAWVNEAREIQQLRIIVDLQSRLGRYPNDVDLTKVPSAVIALGMDSNPPPDDHWIYQKFEVEKPEGWKIIYKPPALVNVGTREKPVWERNVGQFKSFGPAENIENLRSGWKYYERLVSTATPEWLRVMVQGEYGNVSRNSPVFPEYKDSIHFSDKPLEFLRYAPLLLAWDFGGDPACLLMQQSHSGQVRVLREFVGRKTSPYVFANNVVLPVLNSEYNFQRLRWMSVGDPAGRDDKGARGETSLDILRELGIETEPCGTNKIEPRLEAVRHYLRQLDGSGNPSFLIDPSCQFLRKCFISGYRYPEFAPGQSIVYNPVKDDYSHPMDALQYGCWFYKSGFVNSGGQDDAWGVEKSDGGGEVGKLGKFGEMYF